MTPLLSPPVFPRGYSLWYEGHDVLVRFAVETGEPDTVWRGYEVWPVASWDEALWVSTQIASAIEQHRAQRQREALRIVRIMVDPEVPEALAERLWPGIYGMEPWGRERGV